MEKWQCCSCCSCDCSLFVDIIFVLVLCSLFLVPSSAVVALLQVVVRVIIVIIVIRVILGIVIDLNYVIVVDCHCWYRSCYYSCYRSC